MSQRLIQKTFTQFLLVVALVLGALLSGCGSGNGDASTTQPPGETTVAGQPSVAERAAGEVDESYIRESLSRLTGVSPASPEDDEPDKISERGSEEGRRAAARYMERSFEEAGVPARTIEFDSREGHGFDVEATLEGDRKHLWVTAHLDSVRNAGANDDASGLVAILSTARALKRVSVEHTVHFVAYDLEEKGLIGSSRYFDSVVEDVREKEGDGAIIGNLHSDMIGYDGGSSSNALLGTCDKAGPIAEAAQRASKEIGSSVNLKEDCLYRSDHEHFWNASLPAAVLTEGSRYDDYPWYHKPGDTVDKLNIPYLRSIIQLNAATTALLASGEG